MLPTSRGLELAKGRHRRRPLRCVLWLRPVRSDCLPLCIEVRTCFPVKVRRPDDGGLVSSEGEVRQRDRDRDVDSKLA